MTTEPGHPAGLRALGRRGSRSGAAVALLGTACATAAVVALVFCGPALAKFKISIAASESMPAVHQRVTFVVRTDEPLTHNLRLIAVAPGQPVFRVVATITGDTSRPDPNVARHGFEVRLSKIASNRWRGTARFGRSGRWRVVVPNWGPVGVVIPHGAALLALQVHSARRNVAWARIPSRAGRQR